MGNILPQGIIAKYWQRKGKKKNEWERKKVKVAVISYEFSCLVSGSQGRMNERCAGAPSITSPHDSLIYPFVSLSWSPSLYAPSISVQSNLSIYLYYPPIPSTTLELSFCLLSWPLSSWPSCRRSHSCFPGIDTLQRVSHSAGIVQWQSFSLEIQHRCIIVDKLHLHALMTNRPHNNRVITIN